MNVSLVPYGAVAGLVPALMPFLAESERWTRGRAKVDDLLRFVLNGQMQLWAVHDENHVHGHIITEIKQYPQCKMFSVQYCAMQPGLMEVVEEEMQTKAAQFAKDAGCAGIEFVGRPGWRKTANKYGYEVQSVMYQKFFEVS
jgi:hypothetical protein